MKLVSSDLIDEVRRLREENERLKHDCNVLAAMCEVFRKENRELRKAKGEE